MLIYTSINLGNSITYKTKIMNQSVTQINLVEQHDHAIVLSLLTGFNLSESHQIWHRYIFIASYSHSEKAKFTILSSCLLLSNSD